MGPAWLLHHVDNTLIISGTTSLAHLEQNVAVGPLELDADAIARLDPIAPAAGIWAPLNRLRRP